jgi:hypothetical protein
MGLTLSVETAKKAKTGKVHHHKPKKDSTEGFTVKLANLPFEVEFGEFMSLIKKGGKVLS